LAPSRAARRASFPSAERPNSDAFVPDRWGAFSERNYRRFVTGQGLSLVGSWTETVAQGILILQLTDSPVVLGGAVAVRYLPVLLLGPLGGVLVDRHDRRWVLLVTQALLGLVSLAFGVVVLAGNASVWGILVVALLFGLVTVVDNPARMALIPELVPPDALHSAVTINSTLANVGRGLGPMAAAGIIASVGIGWCFIANGATFACVIVALLSMRAVDLRVAPNAAGRGEGGRVFAQLVQALRVAAGNAQIIGPLFMMAVIGTLAYEFEVSLPLLAEGSLGAGGAGYAELTTAFGLGSVVAGVLLLFRPQRGLRRLVVMACLLAATLFAGALSPTLEVALAAFVAVGAASIAFLTTGNSTVQLEAPAGMHGRITSLWSTALTGSTPLGAVLIGLVGQLAGGRAAVLVAAGACALAGFLGVLVLRLVGSRPSG